MLSTSDRKAYLKTLSDGEASALNFHWPFWARKEQLCPGEADDPAFLCWLYLAGRGAGKTRSASQWVIDRAEEGGPETRIALVGRTVADVRDTMVDGESGLMACSPPWFKPTYRPALRSIVWPNGAHATTYTATEPDMLRGPQHTHGWCDETAAWLYDQETWDNLMFGLRLGHSPKVIVTTTPRPTKLIKKLVADPTTLLTRGSTYDNMENLPESFKQTVLAKYLGTRLGRQEIFAEILDDAPGSLWTRALLDSCYVTKAPDLRRVVIALDPAVTSEEGSCNTGIIVAGIDREGIIYILADLTIHDKPIVWARNAVAAYHSWRCDVMIGEGNNGGDLIEANIRTVDPNINFKKVHATRGKHTRAEPVASLFEQGRVKLVGAFPELEDQLCSWEPGTGAPSPDNLDSMVWACVNLSEDKPAAVGWEVGGSKRENPWKI